MLFFFLFALMFIPVAVVCVASVRWARRQRNALLLWPGILALALSAFLFWGGVNEFHYWDGWDLDARPTEQELVGTWRCQNGWVSMRADLSFVTGSGRRGGWTVDREHGVVTAGQFAWRTLAHNGELVLLPTDPKCVGRVEACSDPDTWDKSSACRRDK